VHEKIEVQRNSLNLIPKLSPGSKLCRESNINQHYIDIKKLYGMGL
jgi:hypothetical protein